MVFLTVKFYEILLASTYDIYNYIYKVKKMPQMATLNNKHSANPGGSYHRALYYYSTYTKEGRMALDFLL